MGVCSPARLRQRSPSPVGVREPSWLNFREAAALRKRATRARRRLLSSLAIAHGSVWAPQGAIPALLCTLLLGTRGHVGLDEICALGACHHVGVAAATHARFLTCDRWLLCEAVAVAALGAASFTRRDHRLAVFCMARFASGFAARAASDLVPVVVEESRRSSRLDEVFRHEVDVEASEAAFALKRAPLVGCALGFLCAFCLSLPLVARASLEHGGRSFLPNKLGKLLAWYASLRRATERVPVKRNPPTCHQRALAARDAWRWAHAILAGFLVCAALLLRRSLADARPSERQRSSSVDDEETPPLKGASPPPRVRPPRTQRRVDLRLLSTAALCVDSALALAQFLGAMTFQVALRLPPRTAAVSVLVAYGALLPCAGIVGALILRLACHKRRRKPRKVVTIRSLQPIDLRVGGSKRGLERSQSAEDVRRPAPVIKPPPEVLRAHARRRAAAAVALACLIVTSSLACVTANLWRRRRDASNSRVVGARVALASVATACAALPALAVLEEPQLLATPRAALVRALPLVVAGFAVRHTKRSRRAEDVILPENRHACREFSAPPDFRLAARDTTRLAWLALCVVAAVCIALALRFAKPPLVLRLGDDHLPNKQQRHSLPHRARLLRRSSTGIISSVRTSRQNRPTRASLLRNNNHHQNQNNQNNQNNGGAPSHYESFPLAVPAAERLDKPHVFST